MQNPGFLDQVRTKRTKQSIEGFGILRIKVPMRTSLTFPCGFAGAATVEDEEEEASSSLSKLRKRSRFMSRCATTLGALCSHRARFRAKFHAKSLWRRNRRRGRILSREIPEDCSLRHGVSCLLSFCRSHPRFCAAQSTTSMVAKSP